MKRRPLTNGTFTKERQERNKELQRHCDEVNVDLQETKEVQEGRNGQFKRKGDPRFTEDGTG